MRKNVARYILVTGCAVLLTACSNGKTESTLKDVTTDAKTEANTSVSYDDASTENVLLQDTTEASTVSASASAVDYDNIIDITEKMYVSWINEIYVNTDSYIGKTVKIQGMYTTENFNNNEYHYVYRVGPGCCGNDGSMCGFEMTYDGEYPKDNDWIEVVGVLETYVEDGQTYLNLKADSVTVMEERGSETVTN